jgi:hypothetical protein
MILPVVVLIATPVSYYTRRLMLRIADSALEHGWTREEISHAYDLAIFDKYLDQDADPPRVLIIGPDSAGNFLELIGGELEERDLIWHAMPCRQQYLDLLPDPGGDQ